MDEESQPAPSGTGPLENYQWSTARIDGAVRFVKKAGVAALVLIVVLLFWFDSSSQQQAASYHKDTVNRDQAISQELSAVECENGTLKAILTYLRTEQSYVAAHEKPPVFQYPKPC